MPGGGRRCGKSRVHQVSSTRNKSPTSGIGAGKPSAVEGEDIDEAAFKALVREAIALNGSRKVKASKKAKS